MTVSTNINKINRDGDDVTVAFDLGAGFIFFNSSELRVILKDKTTGVETLQTITTHYTVSGGAGATGTVTFLTAPTSNQEVIIRRVMPLTQADDINNNDTQDAEVVEDALDKIVLGLQQLDEAANRAVRLPESEANDATIPAAVTRRGKVFVYDDDADALPNVAAAADLSLVTLLQGLQALNFASTSADKLGYFTGAGTGAQTDLTAFARTVLAASSASAALALLTAERFSYKGVLTPAQITADTDDYNPSGLTTATVLRVSTDAARNLTGIAGGEEGRLLLLINVGSFNITLKHDQTSTAANRINNIVSADLVIGPGDYTLLLYDSTALRWRAQNRNQSDQGSIPSSERVVLFNAGGTPPHRMCTAEVFVDSLGASQTEMESASASNRIVTPDVQQSHPSSAKAWVQADTGGGVTSSYNVTSITDNGAGDLTVNWDTDFSSSNYCAVASAKANPAGSAASTLVAQVYNTGFAAGTTRVGILRVSDGAGTDPNHTMVVAYGDQ